MEITMKGNPTTIEGTPLQEGDTLPEFTLVDREGNKKTANDFKGKNLLISVYPDINTSVCEKQTRKFFELADKVENATILNVSNNTLEEINNWCTTQGLDVEMLSAQDRSFADNLNLWMPEFEALARSIFVVNKDGKVTYREIVPEMAQEPNYDKALEEVNRL